MQGSWMGNYLLTDLMQNKVCFNVQLSLAVGVMMVELPTAKDDENARLT
jgi:hypothetical protein